MKNLTNHFYERWTERIVGITTDREKKEYITKNKQMITEHANETFEYAELIYKGQIGNNITRNFYIKDDIVFITNTTGDAFVTVYKIDLGFTEELNKTVRRGLLDEISRLSNEKMEVEEQIKQQVEAKKNESDNISEQIKIVELQLSNLRKQKSFLDEEVKNIQSKSLNTGLELRRYALMLVNSKEYKEDITRM